MYSLPRRRVTGGIFSSEVLGPGMFIDVLSDSEERTGGVRNGV